MTLAENAAKFSRIVAAHPDKLKPEAIHEVVRALVAADTAHRGDADRGRYEHLGLQELSKCGIKEFQWVCLCDKMWAAEVSDVMQIRLMCDVVTLLLNSDGVDFAMRYSADVAKAMGQRERTKRVDYLPFDICERILDHYLDGCSSSDEALRPVFEQTSELLEGLSKVQVVGDKQRLIVTSDCVKDVWLPDKYKSFGFKVSTEMPSNLKTAEGNIADLVSMYNFASIMDILVRAITRTRTDQAACSLFVARIDEMCSLSRELLPIGTKVTLGVHPYVYVPKHFLINDTIRVMYRRLFNADLPLSYDSVHNMIQVILRYYDARNGGV